MIVVKVELWPYGVEAWKRTLGELRIANDATGSTTIGNYDVTLMKKTGGVARRGRVERHRRKAVSVWDLVVKAIEATRQVRK